MFRRGRAASSARCSSWAFVTVTRSPPPQDGGGGGVRLGGVVPVAFPGVAGTVVGVPDACPEGLDGPSDRQELSARRRAAASRTLRAPLLPRAGRRPPPVLTPGAPGAADGRG